MSDTGDIETTFQAVLGRAPLPHEVQAYAGLKSSPKELGLQLMASQEFRRRAILGEFREGSTQWVCAEIRDGIKLAISGVSPDDFTKFLKEIGDRLFELTSRGIGREFHLLEKVQSFAEDYFTHIVTRTDEPIEQCLLRLLNGHLEAYEAAIARLRKDLAAGKAAYAQQSAALAESEAKLVTIQHQTSCRIKQILQASAALEARGTALDAQKDLLTARNAELTNQVRILSQANRNLTMRLASLHASNIWRATTVLTRIARRIPAPLRKVLVRGAKLSWWTLTGQLPQRWKRWRQVKRGSGVSVAAPSTLPPRLVDPAQELARWANRRGPVVLIVADRWPAPDRDSASVDAVNLVRDLVRLGFEVVFAVAIGPVQDVRYREGLSALGATPLPQNGVAYVQKYIEENRNIFSLVVLTRLLCGGALFEFVRYNCPDAKIIFNPVDLHFLREQRAAQLTWNQDEIERANKTRDREEWLVGQADLTIVVSEAEREILSASVPRAPVLHLPLTRDINSPTAPFSARKGIGFVGGFDHLPNLDAVRWFLAEIWPLVRQRCPDLTFSIAGSNLPEGIAKPEDGVTYVGPVDDLHAWFETLVVSVAPLRIGAGAKGKVASSLASGLPCVLSSIAAEGMNLIDGGNVLVADIPEAFADRIAAVTSDEALWQRLSDEAFKLAQRQLTHQANLHRLQEALIGLGVQVPTMSIDSQKEGSRVGVQKEDPGADACAGGP
jgi:glycosyltransferase involved in cell wall biosynthesis